MPESIFIVTDSDTHVGYRLAGVRTLSVDMSDNVEKQLEEIIFESGAGLIVVDDYLYENLSESFRKKIDSLKKPVILTIPLKNSFSNKEKSQMAIKYVRDMITWASGINIRLD